ncbi:sulfatase-like hydrolase/transferase [Pseudoalteromonas sp. MTN2-4]|uniref:sulfatase-like hydrolase/transferase n=1 Tax=Pseudoalteromonas sp. MTN2-4 TaxID=3056555 RepID=UPI0036F3DC78
MLYGALNKNKALSIIALSFSLLGCGGGSDNTGDTSGAVDTNHAPVVNSPIGDVFTLKANTINLNIDGSSPLFTDSDGDELSYEIEVTPYAPWLTIINGFISAESPESGTYKVVITATDPSKLSTSYDFTLTVNSPPELKQAFDNQSLTVGSQFMWQLPLNDTHFIDVNDDEIKYEIVLSNSDIGLEVTDNSISGTPIVKGNVIVTIVATDIHNESTSTSFNLKINDTDPVATKPVNILLLIADDMGQDASAQYSLSSDVPNTPNLNALAQRGLVFENLWVNPVCSPTRATLLTGKYGIQTQVLSPGDVLDLSETTLHEQLKADAITQEYATALIGKWHLGDAFSDPNQSGIDYFAGLRSGGVQDYYDWPLIENGQMIDMTTYTTTEFTNRAINWLDSLSDETPWFLWMAYNAPHTPFHLPPSDLHNRKLSGTEEDIEANSRAYYLAAIEALDAEIGRLISSLGTETLENTVILFIGDNGTPGTVRDRNAPLSGAKGSINEGGIRVPMIVAGKGVERIAKRETALINGTDFYSTILDIAGQNVASINNSQSFTQLLKQSGGESRTHIFSQTDDAFTIRNARYKLIENKDSSKVLYDLQLDPAETSDLILGSNDASSILTELENILNSLKNQPKK